MALLLFVVVVAINTLLSLRLQVGGNALPPLGRFLSPQEGFWCSAERAGERPVEEYALRGLEDPVRVVWDESGVPHVFAGNDRDLYRAQGFVVAGLRLWQMDFIARAAAGRISEVVGGQALEFDRMQRRKGMVTGAQASLQALMADPLMAPLLEAYADGVNQHIRGLRYRDLPLEYKLLHHRPEEWSPLRSALIQQYMVENLSGWDRDVEDTHALRALGPELFDLLFPERPPGVAPVVPTTTPWPFVPETMAPPPAYQPTAILEVDTLRSDPTNGSNNWAVHGSRTTSGRPLLANDTHLGLNFPSIWIPIQLATPDHRVFGFTLPGACGVIIGHNEHAAWGVTNAPRDTRDHYRITWRDHRRMEYLHNGRWLPVQHRVERIAVRDEQEVVDSVRVTMHGPVLFDAGASEVPEKEGLALRWMGHEPSMTQKALYLMNRVRTYDDHVEALRWFHTPAQNWVFAATDGTISMRVTGLFPNKWRGQGRFVLDGADPAHRWQGFVPYEHTLAERDPERGYVSSANQHSADEDYPYWTYNGHVEYYRNRRIHQLLDGMTLARPEDMMTLQHDGYDLRSEEALQALLPLVDTTLLQDHERGLLRTLRTWDRVCRADGNEATLMHLWAEDVMIALWDTLQQFPLPLGNPTGYNTVRILGDPALQATVEQAFGIRMTDMALNSFRGAVQRWTHTGSPTWRTHNNARVTHLARIPALGRDELPVDGAGTAVNAQRAGHGPSQRFVVELSSPPRAWFQLAGGVSGNPGSARYDDLLNEWSTLRYREVRFFSSPEDEGAQGLPITVLRP